LHLEQETHARVLDHFWTPAVPYLRRRSDWYFVYYNLNHT
jgi:hypothetical protein